MNSHNQLMVVSATLGLTIGSFLLTQPATALQVEPVSDLPSDWTPLGWKLEGRAGALAGADYELAIGPNGARADNTGQIYWDWENEVEAGS